MALLKALREAPRLLREQPILFVPMAIFAVLQTPQLFLETLDPMVSIVGSLLLTGLFVFVTPVFYAGAIGMANDAAAGTPTSLGRFWSHAKEFYVSVLIAYLFITAVTFGFGFAVSIGILVAFVTVGVGGGGLPLMLGVGGVIALIVLAFLIALFAVHFYAHAIVIEGKGAVDGLSRSVHVVRHNLKSVVGYGLLSLVFGAVFGGVFVLVSAFAFPSASAPGEPAPMPDPLPALLGSGASIVGTALFATFFVVFSVVFYRALVGVDGEPSQAGAETVDHGSDSFDSPNPTE
ncbi:hypothetical protein GRS48_11915 [Halorubrum sp. JWXQ-INN 858]|uniref:DUF7847 domain-containing protein n=1 Tax=Halorubrum sp. JWXQ-INN 858 TaxID=2690782 RepID=UPI00135C4D71|nr:hypothetical protein [Halorubrum sp. JWXQ-INN 858]MWV65518.1 hypothetical protein [Halorubrum sp. JWXQ-INN 858]